MREFVATLIQFIHFLVMVFIMTVPFLGSEYWLTLHIIVIPFIMLHWMTNQTVCALTEIEKFMRGGLKDDETFFGQLVTPIYKSESFIGKMMAPFYKFEDEDTEKLAVWIGLTLLWLVTLFKLQQTDFAHLRADFIKMRRLLPF